MNKHEKDTFACINLTRADIALKTNNPRAYGISDDDMEYMARKIGDNLIDGGDYWLAVEHYGNEYIKKLE